MRLRRRTTTLLLGGLLLAGGLTVPAAGSAAAATTYSCASPSQNWSQIGAYTGYFRYYGYYDGTSYVPVNGGWSSAAVEAQCLLNHFGYGLTVDGYYGARTQAAVADFQSHHVLAVDGYVGPSTWPALRFFAANQDSCIPRGAVAAAAVHPDGC